MTKTTKRKTPFLTIIISCLIIAGLLLLSSCADRGDSFRIKWFYNVDPDTYIYYASAALSEDEQTIYIGTSTKIKENPSRNDFLIALNNDGTLKWQYPLAGGEEVRSSPVVGSDAVCFLTDYRTSKNTKTHTNLVCLDESNGALAFEHPISDNTRMDEMGLSKVIIKDNKVFTVMKFFQVFDITTGTELHKSDQLQTEDDYVNPVVLGDNVMFVIRQTLYTVSTSDYAMNSVVIDSASMSGVLATPAIDSNNTLYFGTDDGYLVAMNTSGELLWETTLGAPIRSSVAIDEMNGLLYVGTKDDENSKLIALAISSGELQWEYEPGGDVYSSPLIGDNGRIYVGSESGYLHAFDSTGEEVWKVRLSQDITWPSPTIDSEGVIYLGGMDGRIYAIQTDSTGLMPGPWSKIHQNNQNTGF